MDPSALVSKWESLGRRVAVGGFDLFVVDLPAGEDADGATPPLFVLHGFPTSSIDYAAVAPALRRSRRVVFFDMLGYGFSDKPDRAYSLFEQADLAEGVAAHLGLAEVDLLTHDMGDSVGGELLARSIDGDLGFGVRRRVLTNGSIYIDMAVFSDGQKMLLELPDEKLTDSMGFDAASLIEGLRATLAPVPLDEGAEAHLRAAAEAVCRDEGFEVLPRLIRYIEERRRHEDRWTGAVESHPAPLTIVWGDRDPIAVHAMAEKLATAVPTASLVTLEGIGHYPMLETPESFTEAVDAALRG